jgi:lipoprotein-anchoring transpeptidase ErfK/SrfK
MTAKHAWLIKDGKVKRGPVPIEIGGPGKETPAGTFAVQWKNKNHRSTEFNNAPMPFAVFFADGGIAFHQGTLQRQSAGCVRLKKSDAESFYDTLDLGDEVQVSKGLAGADK